jgi:hypothetical protein
MLRLKALNKYVTRDCVIFGLDLQSNCLNSQGSNEGSSPISNYWLTVFETLLHTTPVFCTLHPAWKFLTFDSRSSYKPLINREQLRAKPLHFWFASMSHVPLGHSNSLGEENVRDWSCLSPRLIQVIDSHSQLLQ